ncbi:MAG: peptidylprolyl isomerase [Longimicrobiales bacterium]
MKLKASTLVAVFGLAGASTLHAQQQPAQQPTQTPERLGRIVAVVGDSVVTNFELDERYLARVAQTLGGQEPPAGPERDKLLRATLDDRVNELILIQAAVADTSIRVTDEEVNNIVDNAIAGLVRQVGSEAALETALAQQGRTLASYREARAAQSRRDLLISRFLGKARGQRKPPPVTDEEVGAVFETNKGQIGMRPPTISFEQVVLLVNPSDSALARAKAIADSVYQLVLAKDEDFAALARRFSEDAASRELGGDLGWFRTGVMDREFERFAFSPLLRPGDVTPPVKTPYGFHVIKLEKVRGPERQARHILIRPVMSDADAERARAQAEQLAERIRAGELVGEIARTTGDPDEQVRVGPLRRDSLPEPYRTGLAQVTEGQVVGPLLLEAPGEIKKWSVVKVTKLEESRPPTLEDYSEQIRQDLAQNKLIEEILQEVRRRTYIDIRLAAAPSG